MTEGVNGTEAAARAARDALIPAARAAGAGDERAGAVLARGAIFEEALLTALRARFGELRSVAR